jgi:hypothetical protein
MTEKWEVGFSPHGALAGRSAEPTRLLRLRHQPSLHRIPLDVMLDAQPVPGRERFAHSEVFALEDTLWRRAPGKPPRNVDMWRTPAIASQILWCADSANILMQGCGAEAPRGLKPAPQRP